MNKNTSILVEEKCGKFQIIWHFHNFTNEEISSPEMTVLKSEFLRFEAAYRLWMPEASESLINNPDAADYINDRIQEMKEIFSNPYRICSDFRETLFRNKKFEPLIAYDEKYCPVFVGVLWDKPEKYIHISLKQED